MSTLGIAVVLVALALAALYFFMRPKHHKVPTGRADELERPELTGQEQYKRRNPPSQ